MTNAEGAMTQPRLDSVSEQVRYMRWQLVAASILALIFIWFFWDFIFRQIQWGIKEQADWGHTLVIPFIAAYFVYSSRTQLAAEQFKTTWIGFVPIVIGSTIYVGGLIGPQALRHHNLAGTGLWITLCGLLLLFLGWRAMVWLWFPLLYLLVFGQTISERLMNIVTFKLQDFAAIGSHIVLSVGMDVDRQGNTLVLYDDGESKALNIAEACSGMRMLMAFLALGVAMAYVGLQRFWQRALLVVMALPTAVVVNVLRVVTLAILALLDADFAAGDFHSFIGLVWLVPAFLIYLGLQWIIRNLVIDNE